MLSNYKELVKNIFAKKPDYQALYREEQKEAEKWEYKHNKLYRQLNAILKECK